MNDWIKPRGGFGELGERLSSRDCKIAYVGASVTAQKEGYRPYLHQRLIGHFGRAHTAINASIGAVGSITAVFTLDELVLRHRPDLCLIEYSTGDMDNKTPLDQIGPVLEGIVRRLQAIDCQVCFLYLYRRDQNFDDLNPVLREYERIADYYHIPSLNIGRGIEAGISAGELVTAELFRDLVHTTPRGSERTAEFIERGLLQILSDKPKQPNYLELVGQSDLFAKNFRHAQVVPMQPPMLKDRSHFSRDTFRFLYDYIRIDSQNAIECQFDGELVGMMVVVGKESGIIQVRVPGETRLYSLWDADCFYDRLTTQIFFPFFPPRTPIQIRLTEQAIDYTTCRRPLEDIGKIRKNLRVIGFMARL